MAELAGFYRYHRIGHDQRVVELRSDGIADGLRRKSQRRSGSGGLRTARRTDTYQAFEWNLLHEVGHCQFTLCDLDGVICEEWTGGEEEQCPDAYQRHLIHGKPLRLPTKAIRGVVTGRMHIYREQTAAWLRRHNVAYGQLWMLPASTEKERAQIGPANFKARVYRESGAGLFVESCPIQARRIHELTGKPVIDFTNMIAHGATIVQ